MVKKISGKSPKRSANAIEPSKAVKTSKVKTVDSVSATAEKQSTKRVQRSGASITPAQRERLFQLVTEEADQLVKKKAITEDKKETVVTAVKMAIDAGIQEDEEEE